MMCTTPKLLTLWMLISLSLKWPYLHYKHPFYDTKKRKGRKGGGRKNKVLLSERWRRGLWMTWKERVDVISTELSCLFVEKKNKEAENKTTTAIFPPHCISLHFHAVQRSWGMHNNKGLDEKVLSLSDPWRKCFLARQKKKKATPTRTGHQYSTGAFE